MSLVRVRRADGSEYLARTAVSNPAEENLVRGFRDPSKAEEYLHERESEGFHPELRHSELGFTIVEDEGENPTPERPIPVTTYRVILPKRDNSGNRIDPKVLEKYALKMAEQFGGVTTTPRVLGCFKGDVGLECEENMLMESTVQEEGADSAILNRRFITRLGAEAGKELGQQCIYEVQRSEVETNCVPGQRKKSLPESKLLEDPFLEALLK
jgi:hypothetical protein